MLAASWITGQGVSSRSSHSAAAGLTTPSAKPCTHSRMSFCSWLSSSVNFGSPCSGSAASPATPVTCSASTYATPAVSAMTAELTWNRVPSDIAKVEGAQALGALVGAVEEAPVDAVVGLAGALVGPLDRELAVRQRLAGHLHAAEAARLEHGGEAHLGAEDLLHAADVLLAVEAVDVAVEVAAAEVDAAARLDHLFAERAALATPPDPCARNRHWVILRTRERRNPAA